MSEPRTAFVYILECEDGSLYTGITTDVKRRAQEHCGKNGKGAKYTKSRSPRAIRMVWQAKSYASAARLEYAIKHLTRNKKLQLIEDPERRCLSFFQKLEGEQYTPRKEYIMELPTQLNESLC